MTQTDKALDYLDLQTWLEQYVETKTFGTELRIRECPVCGNDKWKLYVNLEKKLWFCQRCTWGKNSRDVCILMSKVSNTVCSASSLRSRGRTDTGCEDPTA